MKLFPGTPIYPEKAKRSSLKERTYERKKDLVEREEPLSMRSFL